MTWLIIQLEIGHSICSQANKKEQMYSQVKVGLKGLKQTAKETLFFFKKNNKVPVYVFSEHNIFYFFLSCWLHFLAQILSLLQVLFFSFPSSFNVLLSTLPSLKQLIRYGVMIFFLPIMLPVIHFISFRFNETSSL